MKFLNKIREMQRKKLVCKILLLIILIYSAIFSSIFLGLSLSLFETIGSISIPDDQLLISLVPENPLLRTSYKISNKGFSDVSNLVINFKVDIYYFEMGNNSETRDNLFFKTEKVRKVDPWQRFESNLEGGSEFFNLEKLNYFWRNANLSKPFFYILNINITGKYCLGLMPFKIVINDLSPECPTCE